MEKSNFIAQRKLFTPEEPSEVYVIVKRVRNPKNPDQWDVMHQVDWRNFPNPLETLNALEIAKATVINFMMEQQMAQGGQNPDFERPPWVKDRN